GEFGIGLRPSGEYGEFELAVEVFKHTGTGYPLFAQDESVFAVTKEDGLKVVAGGFEGDLRAGLGNDVVAELPVVVPAALILVVLNLLTRHCDAGEVFDGLGDAFAVAFGDVHQDAIHVEYDQGLSHWFQISSSAARRRRVCSRVPTVMRTQPGAS